MLYQGQGRARRGRAAPSASPGDHGEGIRPRPPGCGLSLNNLAGVYRSQGRTPRPRIHQQALAIAEECSGPLTRIRPRASTISPCSTRIRAVHRGRAAPAARLGHPRTGVWPSPTRSGPHLNNLAEVYRDRGGMPRRTAPSASLRDPGTGGRAHHPAAARAWGTSPPAGRSTNEGTGPDLFERARQIYLAVS